jgi:beta-phosphoglucomutase-like phosphatase (HAD superfamily)
MRNEVSDYLNKHGFEALRPKAVLFDMDGVLYDSMPNHAVAWQRSMATFGIHMTEADAYATEGARGVDTIRMMVKRQQGRDIDEAEAQLMYDEKTRQFHLMPETKVMPGIPELMEKINDGGLQIGVVTGSGQRPLIDRLLSDFGQYLDVSHITTAYDVKQGKPNPDPYLMGLEKAGHLQPWEAIVIENAPLGVRAGVAARIFTIAVNTGPLPDECLLQEGANMIFGQMTDLCKAWETILLPPPHAHQ